MDERDWALPEQAPTPDPPSTVHHHAGVSGATGVVFPAGGAAAAAPARRLGRAAFDRNDASGPPDLWVFRRPLSLADVLDGAFAVIKAQPRTVIGLAALFVLPVGLVVAIIDIGSLGGDTLSMLFDPDTYDPEASGTATDTGITASIVAATLQTALVTAIAAPLSRILEAWYLRRDLGAIAAVRAIGIGWLWLAVAFVLTRTILLIGSVVLVLPGLAAMAFFCVVAPVIAVERCGPIAGLVRSARLVSRRFFPVLWICLMVALVSGLLSSLLPLLPVAVVELVGLPGREIVVAVATIATSLVALPFVSAAAALVYFDLRSRVEGLDLELAIDEEFRR
jgi:hypothetical protein